MLKVLKFGGSSMADAQQLSKVRSIVESDPSRRVVVVSAAGKRFKNDHKITDLLYLCHAHLQYGVSCDAVFDMVRSRYLEIRDELGLSTPLEQEFDALRQKMDKGISADELVSRGEYFAARLMADYLGFDFLDSTMWLHFRMDGTVDQEVSYQALQRAASGRRVVIPGFYGSMPNDTIRTFSRGGSDITGSIVAAAADADLYENWTDVSGFLFADPHVVDNPQVMKTVTYRELRELSYMGATVIHEDAIFPVMQKKIPIRIKNTNAPDDTGTLILADTDEPAANTVTGIAGRKGFSSINIEKYRIHDECGAVRRMLEVLEEHGVNFEHIPSGIDNFSIVVETTSLADETDDIVYDIKKVTSASSVTVENGIALIAVVGRSMKSTRGVAGTIFSSLAKENINIKMIDQGSSEINIVIAVAERDYERTINTIYSAFVK